MTGGTSTKVPLPAYFNPSSELSYSQIAKSIRAQSRSLENRLKSIHADALFARDSAQTLGFPVFTNSRAGDWYFDPEWEGYEGKCYFKSTDGHYGNYGFSRRRLGLAVLEKLREERSLLILDSTRRGKKFPDSFTKTIPIWIAVFNAYYFGTEAPPLLLHPHVSPQEASRISELVPGFLESLRGLGIENELEKYRPPRPLRAIWANTDSDMASLKEGLEEQADQWCTVVLLMVSRVVGGEGIEGEYIQGAGDDAENWTEESKLSPDIFWKHHSQIMAACNEEGDLEGLLAGLQLTGLVAQLDNYIRMHSSAEVYKTTGIPAEIPDSFTTIINGAGADLKPTSSNSKIYNLPLDSGKKAAKQLRTSLPKLKDFLGDRDTQRWKSPILLLAPPQDPDGTSSAILVFILSWFFDDEGRPREESDLAKLSVTKATVAKRVAWVMLKEEVGISRANLVSVNSALMNWV